MSKACKVEKTFLTAKKKLIHQGEILNEKVLQLKSRSNLNKEEKEEEFAKIILEQIKLESKIELFDSLFWRLIDFHLPEACRN